MPTIELINDTIESLDFDFEQPCEHSAHAINHEDGPAKYLIHAECPDCATVRDYFICASGWRRGCEHGVYCHITGQGYPRHKIWTILREVHS